MTGKRSEVPAPNIQFTEFGFLSPFLQYIRFSLFHRTFLPLLPTMARRAACDRCRAIKSRCLPGVSNNACYRCARLRHTCTFLQKHLYEMRHVRTATLTADAPFQTASAFSPRKTDDALNYVSENGRRAPVPTSQVILLAGIPVPAIAEICLLFSVGPSLGLYMQQTLCSHVLDAPALLMEPYQAVAGAFKRATMRQPAASDSDLHRCAKGLQLLREARVGRVKEACNFLVLGLTLISFQRLIGGHTASTICRFTLALVQPWSDILADDATSCMELLGLQFMDTTHCLFRRQVPMLKCQVWSLGLVHRSAGICCQLLPILYKVCVVGSSLRMASPRTSSDSFINNLRADIECWEPCLPDQFSSTGKSKPEITTLLSQAYPYRTVALLILHRLQYPLGREDERAGTLAKAIAADLERCLSITGQCPPHAVLPLVMAGVEATCTSERERIHFLISRVRGAAFYPYVQHLRELLAGVWISRDCGEDRNVFNLFDQYPNVDHILL
ncbi:hypothetical protein BDV35DRAFT_363142 [Aspergillus flavus]|uniref:Zn(2)-C6 fungal-type domain-containing protein n=3 Tax=Aspergillus subgen. Circumdati TaxID=2720871 RepID=A0A5N6GLX7_ASPFL|nr:hypothetical protein BDV35DRAFT_363142 [Aspergillus flavus]